jgi:hypothetical protein
MKEHDIAITRDLDLASSANALRRHSQLWKLAEGRSFHWTGVLVLGCAILVVGIGFALLFSNDADGMLHIVFGLAMVAIVMWHQRQRQFNALVELVKRIERDARG